MNDERLEIIHIQLDRLHIDLTVLRDSFEDQEPGIYYEQLEQEAYLLTQIDDLLHELDMMHEGQ